ncbi:GPW/gp25 family protein [Amycolatopsis nigrescens]|uniref:GPW/gp25 family protein n=1 Tax=Amycolatopsis nigrescens TaxID=381445 RepID=UPI0003828AEA|nr:GPW/gp25 family protein [Amycolatopsis nigrescens]
MSRTEVDFPYRVDSQGRTAGTGYDEHVRDMIKQLLFTSPGERVMRPDFGCGLLDLVFEPNSLELASTLQLSVQAALQRWLGDVIEVASLEIVSEDSVLRVELAYVVLATGAQRTEVFVEGSAR